ncbi:hypothetical protein MMC25_008095 [Agyrium rufum]|nr:hypothetical protein [Agyrium rufum]
MSAERCAYFFYDNFWYGSGKPLNSVSLESSQSQLVDLLVTFKGRVQRETRIPATWVEFQIKAYNDGAAHGDISVQQGYDGATTIASTDRSNRLNGFADDIMNGVPDGACQVRADGVRCIEGTMGNWLGGPNQAAIDWRHRRIGQKRAYIQGRSGTDDVASSNNCLAVNMY